MYYEFVIKQSLGFASQKNNNMKHGFMFCPPLKKTFNSLKINLVTSKNQHFFKNKFSYLFICVGSFFQIIQMKIYIWVKARQNV